MENPGSTGIVTRWHWLLAGALIALDQGTKQLASTYLSMLEPYVLVPNAISFQLVHNFGAAYGILQNQRPVLLGIGVLVLGLCIFFRNQLAPTPISRWGLMILFAGTFGNFFDRFRLHYVVDFIDIRIFPVFNVSDVLIDIGLALFLLDMILEWWKSRSTSSEA